MKSTKCLLMIVLLFIINNSSQAQLVREWKTVANGSFTATFLMSNLAAAQGKYLAAVSNGSNGFDSTVVLILSDNGGKTWFPGLKEKLMNIDSNYMPLPGYWRQRYFQSVVMPSNNLILLTGIETYKNGSENHPFLYRSVDFGTNWERIEISKDTLNYFRTCLSMLNDSFGIMISGKPKNPGKPSLYKTKDGGISWEEFSIGNKFDEKYLVQIKCFSKDEYTVVCQDSVFKTSDGGVSWNTNSVPNNGSLSIFRYSFLNKNIWFTAGQGNKTGNGDTYFDVLYKTTTGGANWLKLLDTIIIPSFGFAGVDFYDENNGIVGAAAGSNILRTTDGGISWELQVNANESYDENMSQVKFFNKEQAVVLSEYRVYLYTGNYVLMPPTVKYSKDTTGILDYKINWNRIVGGTHFKIQVSEHNPETIPPYFPDDFNQNLIVNTDNLTDTVLNLSGKLKFQKFYYIHVKTYNDSMESDWSKMIMLKTPADTVHYPKLDTCLLVEPTIGASNLPLKITFKWNKVLKAEDYILLVTQPKNIASGKYDFYIENIKDTVYTIDSFLPNTFYIWWVTANAKGYLSSAAYYRDFMTGNITAVEEFAKSSDLIISPNPTTDILVINLNKVLQRNGQMEKIEIYSSLGVKLLETEFKERIDISGLAPRVYFLKAGNKVYKFVKM